MPSILDNISLPLPLSRFINRAAPMLPVCFALTLSSHTCAFMLQYPSRASVHRPQQAHMFNFNFSSRCVHCVVPARRRRLPIASECMIMVARGSREERRTRRGEEKRREDNKQEC